MTTKRVTPTKEEKVETVENKEKFETVIYCGPTLRKVDLRSNQVFNNGIPKLYETAMKECPAVRSLFVPVKNLTKVQAALTNSGSPESILYKKVQNYANGGEI